MRAIAGLIILWISYSSVDQEQPPILSQTSNDKIADTIHSKILNEDRFIWLHIPKAQPANKRLPVIFVLDAEANFDETQKTLDKLSKEPASNTAANVILVGIGNIWQRYRDYSPTHVEAASAGIDAATAKTTGGGEAFVSFLEKEVLPHIEKKYPVSSNRTLIGHSMGGLMVIYILLKHTALFDNYVAIDPALWWDNHKLLNEGASILGNQQFGNKRLFLAIANETEVKMMANQIKKDTSSKTTLTRPSFLLADIVEKNKQNKLNFQWKFYQDEHHMTVNTPATHDALKTLVNNF
jgi:predicted alpha/beta superfamily hydrolase